MQWNWVKQRKVYIRWPTYLACIKILNNKKFKRILKVSLFNTNNRIWISECTLQLQKVHEIYYNQIVTILRWNSQPSHPFQTHCQSYLTANFLNVNPHNESILKKLKNSNILKHKLVLVVKYTNIVEHWDLSSSKITYDHKLNHNNLLSPKTS